MIKSYIIMLKLIYVIDVDGNNKIINRCIGNICKLIFAYKNEGNKLNEHCNALIKLKSVNK